MPSVLKNEYIKLKKKVFILKYIEFFAHIDVNPLKANKMHKYVKSHVTLKSHLGNHDYVEI